jgi:arylsulfatase A-like enzyme
VPAIVIYPGHIAKDKRDAEHLVSGVDIPATICDYAAVPMLPRMTIGRSMRPVLEGKSPPWRDYVIGESMLGSGQVGIRDKQFKTILYQNDAAKIYDLKNDPLEKQNLADTEEGKAVKRRHMGYMRQYISSIEPAPVPVGNKVGIKYKSIYEKYNSWYKQILKEA